MNTCWKHVRTTVALLACCWMISWGASVRGQDESSVLLDGPTETELAPPTMMPQPPSELTPPPALAEPTESVPVLTPHVNYRTHLGARRMYRRSGEMQTAVVAENPVDCCLYHIPLCIPCCCTDEPTVASRCGLLGRGVVEYCWSCGFRAKVVFRARGDVVVHYGT